MKQNTKIFIAVAIGMLVLNIVPLFLKTSIPTIPELPGDPIPQPESNPLEGFVIQQNARITDVKQYVYSGDKAIELFDPEGNYAAITRTYTGQTIRAVSVMVLMDYNPSSNDFFAIAIQHENTQGIVEASAFFGTWVNAGNTVSDRYCVNLVDCGPDIGADGQIWVKWTLVINLDATVSFYLNDQLKATTPLRYNSNVLLNKIYFYCGSAMVHLDDLVINVE